MAGLLHTLLHAPTLSETQLVKGVISGRCTEKRVRCMEMHGGAWRCMDVADTGRHSSRVIGC